jgi:hypothetical protein
MPRLIFIGPLGLLVLVILGMLLKTRRSTPSSRNVYNLRQSLFSPAERSFFGLLDMLAMPDVVVICKVRLIDIFEVIGGLDHGVRKAAENKISQKHVDFLMIQKSDGKPILGIELDDSSHLRENRVDRDRFVNEVFESVRLPLLRVPVRASYAPAEIRRQIDAALASYR